MTTILTFWLCAINTTCGPPVPIDAAHQQELNIGLAQCDEFDALTNLPYFDVLLARGMVPRHKCEIKSEDL